MEGLSLWKKVNVKRHASKANDAPAMYWEAGFGGILWKIRIALVKGKSVRGMEIVRLAKPFMLFLSGSFHASVELKQRDKFPFCRNENKNLMKRLYYISEDKKNQK